MAHTRQKGVNAKSQANIRSSQGLHNTQPQSDNVSLAPQQKLSLTLVVAFDSSSISGTQVVYLTKAEFSPHFFRQITAIFTLDPTMPHLFFHSRFLTRVRSRYAYTIVQSDCSISPCQMGYKDACKTFPVNEKIKHVQSMMIGSRLKQFSPPSKSLLNSMQYKKKNSSQRIRLFL